jgi:tetratricopeptide (TPR) repeat protein
MMEAQRREAPEFRGPPEEGVVLRERLSSEAKDMPAERRWTEGEVTEEKEMAGRIGAADRDILQFQAGEAPSPQPGARALDSEARLARPARDLDSGLLVRAEEALEAGDYARARETFQEIVAHLDPSDPVRSRALLGLARTYEELGELDEAKKVYETLADESPSLRELANRKIQELLERQ